MERLGSDATRNRDLQSPRNFSSSSLRGLKFGSAKSFSGLTLVTGNTRAGKSSRLKKLRTSAQNQLSGTELASEREERNLNSRRVADVTVVAEQACRDWRRRRQQAIDRSSRRCLLGGGEPLVEELLLHGLPRAVQLPQRVNARDFLVLGSDENSVNKRFVDRGEDAAHVFPSSAEKNLRARA